MRAHYLLSMLSLSVAHLVLALTFMTVTGRYDRLEIAIPVNLVWLIGINAAGAYYLFSPINHFLKSRDGLDAALARLRHLRAWSVAWGVALVLPLTAFSLFVVEAFCPGCKGPGLTPWLLMQVLIFTLFCGAYLYFLIGDFVSRLRVHLFRHFDVVVKAAGGQLIYELIVAFVSIGVIPLAIVILNLFVPGKFHPSSSIGPRDTALFYLLISMFMSITAFFFIQRHLRRPIEALRKAMHKVSRGRSYDKSPVMTDDEFGVIAQDFNRMADGLKEQQIMRDTFGRYIPREVAKLILDNAGVLKPQRQVATVLYTDIQGFTSICESLTPEDVVTMLNDYFTVLVEIIRAHEGVITQFQGDAILAVFNVPIKNLRHAGNAVRAAMEIQEVLTEKTFSGGIRLPTRIGINTGPLVSGSVGEGHRLSYTVHGDAVNLAARLEQLNKQLGTWTLISQQTHDAAGAGFEFKPLGEYPIRGRSDPVFVYEVPVLHHAAPALRAAE